MKQRLAFSIVFLFILFLFGYESANACSCGGGANPCGFFRGAKGVAFIGTVTNVVDSNEKYGQPIKGRARKITIKVDEVFMGNLPGEISTSDDGFQCDNFPFSLGKTYLIYSKGVEENTENIVKVGLCSGTSPIEKAEESVNFLRRLKRGETFSILYGKVQKTVNDNENHYVPLSKTKVVLTKIYAIENGQYKEPKKKDRTFETFTDGNGEYKFENLTNGKYKLNAVLPDNLWVPEYREFGAGGTPFCENHSLTAYTNGRISGNVTSADGMPVGFLKLRISPVDKNTRSYYAEAQTDKNGNYTFYGLSEGRYKIHVYLPWYSLDRSKSYPFEGSYPFSHYYFGNVFEDKQSEIINLGFTEKIQNINLKMPSLPKKNVVNGLVLWEDGTIPTNAVITYRVKRLGDNSRRYAYQNKDGTFSFPIFEEFEYDVMAANNSNEIRGISDWVTVNQENLKNPIKLVMKAVK